MAAKYVIGQAGEQVTELAGDDSWRHTNVYAAGALLATYDAVVFTSRCPIRLGLRRIDILYTGAAVGQVDQRCYSLAFGDGQVCDGADATEQHFTGKERDAESGLDNFGAALLRKQHGEVHVAG